jgi:hypothetical protein
MPQKVSRSAIRSAGNKFSRVAEMSNFKAVPARKSCAASNPILRLVWYQYIMQNSEDFLCGICFAFLIWFLAISI